MTEARAAGVGEGRDGGGNLRRDDAVIDLESRVSMRGLRREEVTYFSVNWYRERVKRNAVIGPQNRGTTHHFVRVNA
jgi:hypothetical protein